MQRLKITLNFFVRVFLIFRDVLQIIYYSGDWAFVFSTNFNAKWSFLVILFPLIEILVHLKCWHIWWRTVFFTRGTHHKSFWTTSIFYWSPNSFSKTSSTSQTTDFSSTDIWQIHWRYRLEVCTLRKILTFLVLFTTLVEHVLSSHIDSFTCSCPVILSVITICAILVLNLVTSTKTRYFRSLTINYFFRMITWTLISSIYYSQRN